MRVFSEIVKICLTYLWDDLACLDDMSQERI